MGDLEFWTNDYQQQLRRLADGPLNPGLDSPRWTGILDRLDCWPGTSAGRNGGTNLKAR